MGQSSTERGEHTPGIVEQLRDADAFDYPIGTEDLCEKAADLISELVGALDAVDEMFSRPGAINKNSVRDKVRAARAKARGGLR